MSDTVIQVENLSKLYRLGEVGTGTVSHDLNRWWHKVRGKEDPYLKIGQTNDRTTKGDSDYVWALKDVSFEVKRGEVLGIIGRNGAGKSTLLKILSRVTSPTTGQIRVKGRIASLLEVGTGFHPELTGRENVYLNGAILGMRKHEIMAKFDEIVAFAEVERYVDTPVKRYSSGMYVRLAFAVAAHLEPEILIVDEVLAVGDAEFQKKCVGKLRDVAGHGRTVLFVSHNTAAIKRLCSTGLLLSCGAVAHSENVDRVLESYLRKGKYGTFRRNIGPLREVRVEQVRDTLEICAHYSLPQPVALPCLGFVISDVLGNPICGLNPLMSGIDGAPSKSREGIVRACLRHPKLINGTYTLSIWFGDGKTDSCAYNDVLTFEVMGMAPVTQRLDRLGNVFPACDWKFEDGTPTPPSI